MGIKSWLFGRDRKEEGERKGKQTEAVAKLKRQLNSLDQRSKSLARKSEEQKRLAKQMLKEGNKVGARQALTRSNIYMQKYNKIQNMSLNLSSQVDVIQETQDTVETVEALKTATVVVNETLEEISAIDVERTMTEMEDQRDQLEMMSDALSDTTGIEMGLDGEMLDSIDDQLAAMELEIQSESHGDLPAAGTATTSTFDFEDEEEEEKKEDTSDLEDELEALQKELDGKES